jgi:hypothetical protein
MTLDRFEAVVIEFKSGAASVTLSIALFTLSVLKMFA